MTLFELFHVAALVLSAAPEPERAMFSPADAVSIALDVAEAVPEPVWPGEQAFLVLQAWREGRWQASPRGGLAEDCGVVQIKASMIPAGYGSCEALRSSRVLALRAWHTMAAATIARCGGVRAGLGALFSTGKCGAVPQIVAYRCALAGGAC